MIQNKSTSNEVFNETLMWQQIESMFVGKWYVHVGIERAYIHLAAKFRVNFGMFESLT